MGYSAGVYSTLNQQMKKYRDERDLQESDERHTKYKMLKQRAEEQGLDTSAQRVASMLERVSKIVEGEQPFGKEGPPEHTEQPPKSSAFNIILNAIKNKTLSKLWDNMKKVPRDKLSPVARIIQDDIKHNETLRSALNEKISAYQQQMEHMAIEQHKKNREMDVKDMISNYANTAIDDVIQLLEGDKKNRPALTELLEDAGGMETVNENVAREISTQRAKFGTISRASSEASTEQGTEMENTRLGAPTIIGDEAETKLWNAIRSLGNKIYTENPVRDFIEYSSRVDTKKFTKKYPDTSKLIQDYLPKYIKAPKHKEETVDKFKLFI